MIQIRYRVGDSIIEHEALAYKMSHKIIFYFKIRNVSSDLIYDKQVKDFWTVVYYELQGERSTEYHNLVNIDTKDKVA